MHMGNEPQMWAGSRKTYKGTVEQTPLVLKERKMIMEDEETTKEESQKPKD